MKALILFLIFTKSMFVYSQDERYFNSIFDKKYIKENTKIFHSKIEVSSDKYMIDLDRDGVEEAIQSVKKDGIDFIRISNVLGVVLFERKLETKGSGSSIFKISFRKISKDVDTLILHFNEGYTHLPYFKNSARLYFLTIEFKNLKTIYFKKGPMFWAEVEKPHLSYWNRRYVLSTKDFNRDGTREILVSYNRINYLYFYLKEGIWRQ